MLLTFLSIWMSVIVSETSIIIRYFHELFCVIFFWNGILCMHSFSSIMMAYVIVQLYARYLKGIEFTNVKWYFINNDNYIKSNIIIDPILISTCFYEIAQITYEKIFHVYARFFCLQYKIWLQYILIDVMQGIFDSLVCSLCKRMIDDKSYL